MKNRHGRSSRYTPAFRRVPRDQLSQSSETPVLEHTYGPRALAQDRGNIGHVEPAHDPKQDHLSHGSRQARSNQSYGLLRPDDVESGHGGVITGGTVEQVLRCHRDAGTSRFPPSPVDEAIARDGEHPGAELPLVSFKVREVSSSHEPRLGLDVFRCYRVQSAQEPQQPGMQLAPEDGDRLVGTLARGAEHMRELRRRHFSRRLLIRDIRRPVHLRRCSRPFARYADTRSHERVTSYHAAAWRASDERSV